MIQRVVLLRTQPVSMSEGPRGNIGSRSTNNLALWTNRLPSQTLDVAVGGHLDRSVLGWSGILEPTLVGPAHALVKAACPSVPRYDREPGHRVPGGLDAPFSVTQ